MWRSWLKREHDFEIKTRNDDETLKTANFDRIFGKSKNEEMLWETTKKGISTLIEHTTTI